MIIIIFLALEHSCTYPGCRSVLVVDGNMKNRRGVCMAKDAGYIEFHGLPGSVKTGCQATPSYKSRYCASHMPQGCEPVRCIDDEELNEAGSTIGKSAEVGNVIAEVIVSKKVTRRDTYYQVGGMCVHH